MKALIFSKRCAREIIRDPLSLLFGLGFPVVLILLLSIIQKNVPVPLFEIESLAPGAGVFGLSFMTLFSATLVARDRESALLQRLYTSPLRARDFILGYMLPLIAMSIPQGVVCFTVAICLGLPVTPNIALAIVGLIPSAVLYVAIGVLCGSIFNVKQVGGICGALFTNLTAWLSGVWFDIDLLGGVFSKIADILPFIHAVELERAIISGSSDGVATHLIVVVAYAAVATVLAVLLFLRQMRRN